MWALLALLVLLVAADLLLLARRRGGPERREEDDLQDEPEARGKDAGAAAPTGPHPLAQRAYRPPDRPRV